MITVLIAGIAGASLGTELAKSLRLAGGYRILGCDISPLAFGHYADFFDGTKLISRKKYIEDILTLCRAERVTAVVPGGDEPMKLIAQVAAEFARHEIKLAINAPDVVSRLADKRRCFKQLSKLGFAIPRTVLVKNEASLTELSFPCIIKPSVASGGSAFVFFAKDKQEAQLYAAYLARNGKRPLAQEYIGHERGEFTVGVVSNRERSVVGAVALKRVFPSKLSVLVQGSHFLISSGYSQGHIGPYPEICAAAKKIAEAVGSCGPLNVQGRLDEDGRFLPFVINPRFSASTYLRALSGFNEVDYYVKYLLGVPTPTLSIRPRWYLRSLTETAVEAHRLIS